jgi:anti-anti-sigma factor
MHAKPPITQCEYDFSEDPALRRIAMNERFIVEGELTVFTVHALKDRIMAALAESSTLQINLSDVSEVDGAGIQLLLAAKREAQQRGGTLSLTGHPPQFIAALELTDLAREFGDPLVLDMETPA